MEQIIIYLYHNKLDNFNWNGYRYLLSTLGCTTDCAPRIVHFGSCTSDRIHDSNWAYDNTLIHFYFLIGSEFIQIYQCYKKLTIITPLEPYRYPLKPHDYLLQQGIHPHLSYPFPYPFHGNPHQWWRPQVEVNLKKSWRIMEIMSSRKSLQKEKISRRNKTETAALTVFG